MGNYRQHISFASFLGVVYAWGAYALVGVHWLYGSVAALVAALGGLLPDLDHPIGVELKGFTGILGVLVALAVWRHLVRHDPTWPFELQLWAVVAAYLLVRHGLRRALSRLMVHRGISHSIPACAVWGAFAYLIYPASGARMPLKVLIAGAVMVGFLSHLLLDEICSVDLKGHRVNRAFGTAMKFWSSDPWATFWIYVLLSYLSWIIIRDWPEGPWLRQRLPDPDLPFDWPPRLPPLPQPFESPAPQSTEG